MKKRKIDLGTGCNYRCFYCKACFREGQHLSVEEAAGLCEEAADLGAEHIELGGGEPLLYPELSRLIQEIRKQDRIKRISVSTNGSLLKDRISELTAAGLDEINLHMDVPDAGAYARITGRTQVLNDILSVIWSANAKNIPLTVSVYLHQESGDYLGVMAGLAKKFDITVRFIEVFDYSSACGLGEAAVIRILQRHFPDLKRQEDGAYSSSLLKGKLAFAKISGEQDKEQE